MFFRNAGPLRSGSAFAKHRASGERSEHDPEKWKPVFRKDHAQTKNPKRDDDSKKSHPDRKG